MWSAKAPPTVSMSPPLVVIDIRVVTQEQASIRQKIPILGSCVLPVLHTYQFSPHFLNQANLQLPIPLEAMRVTSHNSSRTMHGTISMHQALTTPLRHSLSSNPH